MTLTAKHMATIIGSDGVLIGPHLSTGEGVDIRAREVSIGEHCTIADGVTVRADRFVLGPCSYLGPRVSIRCWQFAAGSYCYVEHDVEVWPCHGPESVVRLGDCVFLGAGTILNTHQRITVGNEVGIGARVGLWTHGGYLPVTEGFPYAEGPIQIGNKVWLPGQSQVLPGVTIGDHVVVSMLSLVKDDLPSGALAGGIPARVLKAGWFPAAADGGSIGVRHLFDSVLDVVIAWNTRAQWLGLPAYAQAQLDRAIVVVHAPEPGATFNFRALSVRGLMTDAAEDFRDFCRRRGFRFLMGKPFRSLDHPTIRSLDP